MKIVKVIFAVSMAVSQVGGLLGRAASAPKDLSYQKATISSPILIKPAGVDIDVTYISRTPMYYDYQVEYIEGVPQLRTGTESDKRWPDYGEIVTFSAHIMNKGTESSGSFEFHWKIDESLVASGTQASLTPGQEVVQTYQWPWDHILDGERLLGQHKISFTADPANNIPETYETNNTVQNRTDALPLYLAVPAQLYADLEIPVDPKWSYSAEDWLGKQITAINKMFERSTYPSASSGVTERVYLDRVIVSDQNPGGTVGYGGFYMTNDDREGGGYYDPVNDVSGGLVHELMHQLGIIDLYNIGFALEVPQVTDKNGQPVQMMTGIDTPGIMTNPGYQPLTCDEHTTLALNANKGYRRGYYGEYLFDLPSLTKVQVLDNQGNPVSGVTLRFFQKASSPNTLGSLHGVVDDVPEINVTTDSLGIAILPNRPTPNPTTTHTNHILHDNPFGAVDVVGNNDEFILEITKGNHQEFTWLDITQINLMEWRGQDTYAIHSHVPPANAPSAPELTGSMEKGDIQLDWKPEDPNNIAFYDIYTIDNLQGRWIRKITGITQATFRLVGDYPLSATAYAITASNSSGMESGFSNIFWALRTNQPADIVANESSRNIILDPQNGYSLLLHSTKQPYYDTLGSYDVHLEFSKYLDQDPNGNLIVSHPADFYSERHSIRILDRNGNLINEFGERGSGPGQLDNPAGIAVWQNSASLLNDQGGVKQAITYSILVVDRNNNRILVFDQSGNFITSFGQPGATQGSFSSPSGIAAGRDGKVAVADTGNNRVQIFQFNGMSFTFSNQIGGLNQPAGVEISRSNNILVADSGNNAINVYDPGGALLAKYQAGNDNFNGNFNQPQGFAEDPDGNLIIADSGNQRVTTLFSPPPLTGKDIFFVSDTDGDQEIYHYEASSGNVTQITTNSSMEAWPTVSSDGGRICFESDQSGDLEIFCSASDGTSLVNISNTPGEDGMPRFSPRGDMIAYHHHEPGSQPYDWEIWVMNADGTNKRRLTNEIGYMGQPAWFPDGKRLVFDGDKPDRNLLTINLDGSGVTTLNSQPGEQRSPSVSADGNYIYYDSSQNGPFQVFRMRTDGTEQTPLTAGSSEHFLPQISPDGYWLTYHSTDTTGKQVLFTGDWKGKNINKLSMLTAFMPAWGGTPSLSALPDLDVAYIGRTPRYDYDADKNSPSQGDLVIFEGHIANRGGKPSGNFNYAWFIDGVNVYSAAHASLAPGEMVTLTINWTWQNGPHTVRLSLDPNDTIREVSEQNNTIEDPTDALAIGLWVEQSVYDYFNQHQIELGIGSTSWDDWAQRQVRVWNQMFKDAISPLTPQGIIDRVRLDKVSVVPDKSLPACHLPAPSDKTIDLQWGFPATEVGIQNDMNCGNPDYYFVHPEAQNVEYSLFHELSHARYLIDLYGISVYAYHIKLTVGVSSSSTTLTVDRNIENDDNFTVPAYLAVDGELIICQGRVANSLQSCSRGAEGTMARSHPADTQVHVATVRLQDGHGNLIQGSSQMPYLGIFNEALYITRYPDDLMVGGVKYGQYSAYVWNRIAHQRPVCGNANRPCNYGVFMNDLPDHNILEIFDLNNQPLQGARVELFIGKPFDVWYGKIFTGTPDRTFFSNNNGQVDLGRTLFGEGNVVHEPGWSTATVLLKISSGNQAMYRFFDVTEANEAFWSGQQFMARYVINTSLPAGNPLQSTYLPLILKNKPLSNRSIFYSSKSDGNSEIYRYDLDIQGITRITTTPAAENWVTASPDGNTICFESDRTGNLEIFCSDRDGNAPRNISNTPGEDGAPSFSPDGDLIAYQSRTDKSSPWAIWLMNANGTNKRRLTFANQSFSHPKWFPDGSKLVFEGRQTDTDIFTMNVDGSGLAVINDKYGEQRNPSVSSYGQYIYYDSSENGKYQIFRMRSNGGGQAPITFGYFDSVLPQVSPDDRSIVYSSNPGGSNWGIYAMSVDGKHVRHISSNDGPDTEPAWSPCCGGAITNDANSLLLLNFNGNYVGAEGEQGTVNDTTFTKGRFGQGVSIGPEGSLTYPTEGNILLAEGTVEFWVKPKWDGGDGKVYTFFEIGNSWLHRMRLFKDGDALRFLLWDSSREYGVGCKTTAWKAGEWHHVAAMWRGAKLSLRMDGVICDSIVTGGVPDYLIDTMTIGSSAWHDQHADAVIDEFRISNTVRFDYPDLNSLSERRQDSPLQTIYDYGIIRMESAEEGCR
jgi:Tol biopolymer transport system component